MTLFLKRNTLHYATFDQALALVSSFGPGALMANLDLKHAFRPCPVSPSDWDLLAMRMHWQGKFHVDFSLPLAPSPHHSHLTVHHYVHLKLIS